MSSILCNDIKFIIPHTLDPISAKFVVCLYIAFDWVTKEHAGESGVQLSVGAEMEAYGHQASAAGNLIFLQV